MYTVIEFWTPNKGDAQQTVAYQKNTKNEALSSYHYILYQAAVSEHYKHGAVCMDDEGRYLAREFYEHYTPEEPEEPEEPAEEVIE